MCLLAISDSPEACVPIRGLIHGAALTSTVDVRPLRACKIAVNGNFMCHTGCKWARQILPRPSIYVSHGRKAEAQWPRAVAVEQCYIQGCHFNNLKQIKQASVNHQQSKNQSFITWGILKCPNDNCTRPISRYFCFLCPHTSSIFSQVSKSFQTPLVV